jgi:lipoic acid synthetase
MADLRSVGVSIVTIGQYLLPTSRHLPVVEFIAPEKFNWFKEVAMQMGFLYVAAGPFVRSSYKAGEFFMNIKLL